MRTTIAFVCNQTFTPWGGSEILWYEAAFRLIKLKVNVAVYFPKWPTKTKEAKALELAGCRVTYYTFIKNFYDKLIFNLNNAAFEKAQHQEKINWLKAVKPDLLVLTDLAPRGREWMLAASSAGVKYVMNSQLADETLWHSAEELQQTGQLYKQAARLYFLSKENITATEKQLCLRFSNAQIIYNPYNVNADVPFSYPPLQDNRWNIACVARMGIEHKRQDILLEILAEEKWRDRQVNLNFYGKGFHESSLKNLSKFYNLNHVFFKGHVENVNQVWSLNHAFALPSRYEGVSLAMQEALISYRTCIVTKVGGVANLIEDNKTGFVAAAATTELFAEAMERAWMARENWNTIGLQAGQFIRSKLPKDPVGHFTEQLLELLS